MRYLLIGNGPSARAREVGNLIDSFDGRVVRFNHYLTKGHERWVGSRTDIWATVGEYPEGCAATHRARWWLQLGRSAAHEASRQRLGATLPPDDWRSAAMRAGCSHPTSGLALAAHLIATGHEVVLWGFDFMSPLRPHHYADSAPRGTDHLWWEEWTWFAPRLYDGRVSYLGWDRQTQGAPIVRLPAPCGSDANPAAGREATQLGWYAWAARRCAARSVLDVGAGTCAGLKILEQSASTASGIDLDPRLAGTHPHLRIGGLADVPSASYDVVAAIDVLEHVVDDIAFLTELRRIAKAEIIVSTPNGHRSQCQNAAHCREYTIPQFANVFRPDELWTGSPDGHLHRTLLLESSEGHYLCRAAEGPDNQRRVALPTIPIGGVPWSMRFNDTVDGEEWPHITAIFRIAPSPPATIGRSSFPRRSWG